MSKIPALPSIERRITPGLVEFRAAEGAGKSPRIAGYAAKFNVRSENMGYGSVKFFEVIEPGAFADVLNDDVRCLFNHDANLILGRTLSKTCRIAQDATGLTYECDADEEQSYTRDLLRSLQRKDVTQSSFAFAIARDGQRWVEEGDTITRYIKKVTRLYDVSPVTYPAYPDATSEARSIHELIESARTLGLLAKGETPPPTDADIARRTRELQLADADV
jgi:HK97 family phage prohead protease